MSAYIVEDSTINIIVTAIEMSLYDTGGHGAGPLYIYRELPAPYYKADLEGPKADKFLQALALDLHKMNVDAINERYSHHQKTEYDFSGFKRVAQVSRVQLYKTMQCFLYQCNEGEIDKRELFQALDRMQATVAAHIVASLPEYEKAKWG